MLKCCGGYFHTIALRSDGGVRCWGQNYYGQCDTPTDLGPCSSVAGGGNHTIALRSDGGVQCWGKNGYGQCIVPMNLGPCSSIAGGSHHTIAIEEQCPQCPSSLEGNCLVNGADLGMLLSAWGSCPAGTTGCTGDINRDGFVNGADLGILLNAWGPCLN
jgi:alpha-tubulin suppressor-like RCC1 family protein